MTYLHDAYGQETQQLEQVTVHNPRRRILEDQCRASIAASISTAAETNELSRRTAGELLVQGEQIQRIDRDTRATEQTLNQTSFLINKMTSWIGTVTSLFLSPPSGTLETLPQEQRLLRPTTEARPAGRNPELGPVLDERHGFDREIATDLGQLSGILNEIRSQAVETGHELKNQNEALEGIAGRVLANDARLATQRKDLQKLSRS